ncbi:NADP-dependent 3-hydroxy acid dehydrogenase YdfG [Actinocorallia herbida]|uniref:NADP-dependent 3-hydroxy acid dehydrogenase YdfG n=1 Tax=Actinocorallia herbida TaxID=58109 RepID=A0A3N1D3B1_9ACTN|nr:SDR family oxidoreductase [Actinocorallia herbida]ROO88015.1 NADP-dependent 3-hydroxy acid dehydrogenase YdfG [Actinocorallia herbida]
MTGVLAGRTAVVTGASRGTGLAIALALAAEGARVGLLARPGPHLDSAASRLGAAGLPLPADLCDPAAVRAAFALVHSEFGGLDILVNNAAMAEPHLVEEATDAELAREVGTNLLGPLYTTREAVPLLRASRSPHLVNLSSESSADPFPYLLVYAATKAALERLTEGLAHELRPDGIRCTLLKVGRTETTFKDAWDPERLRRAVLAWEEGGFRARVSGSAAQPPERVAEAVLFAVTREGGSVIGELSVRSYPDEFLERQP